MARYIVIKSKKKSQGVHFDSDFSLENHHFSLQKGKQEITRSCKNITSHGLK